MPPKVNGHKSSNAEQEENQNEMKEEKIEPEVHSKKHTLYIKNLNEKIHVDGILFINAKT